jgi:hypothetical protein
MKARFVYLTFREDTVSPLIEEYKSQLISDGYEVDEYLQVSKLIEMDFKLNLEDCAYIDAFGEVFKIIEVTFNIDKNYIEYFLKPLTFYNSDKLTD